MIFNRRKKDRDHLLQSFGKLKEVNFNFNQIEKYFRGKKHTEVLQAISDKTCNDLDFEELFMFLDRTSSKVGQQYLYNRLRSVPAGSNDTKAQEDLIELLSTDSEFRVSLQRQLGKLNSNDSYYISSLFQEEHIKPPKWFFLVPILSFTTVFSLILMPFNPNLFFVLITAIVINLGLHYWNKRNLYRYTNAMPQLVRLNRVARDLFKNKELKKLNTRLDEALRVLDRVKNRMLLFKFEGSLEGDFAVIFWTFLELIKSVFLIEPILLFGVLKRLDTRREEIESVFAFVGQVDALISIASLRMGLDGYCIPEIVENRSAIVAKEAYHPLIPDCVTNSIEVGEKSILLTGSNMSGKTSFIRTIGLNTLTALTLNTCFATSFALPRLKIFSAIRISDDLMNDKSYYFEEVQTIKEMIGQSDNGVPNLFLLDEIFKGTNTVERISAGKAVLSYLAKGSNMVFVSTHDIELGELLEEEYQLYHFSEQVDDRSVAFDYKLKSGKLKNRNAIRILQINDYPNEIISEAMGLSRELDAKSIQLV
ncbi:MAG: hypothetical protein ACEPOZ_22390 [Marinifilaceae bacterium]